MNHISSQTPRQAFPLTYFAWGLVTAVSLLAVYVWGHSLNWQLGHLTVYQFFPLLGLLAFSIMWTHYMTGALKGYTQSTANLQNYFKFTGYVVLGAILLHPGLLILQRFIDGYGLPPKSYTSYVAPGKGWIVTLGSISWLAFIAFEFRRLFEKRTWWKYVLYAGDGAMVAIFYHGLQLGSQLQMGWYIAVWYLYGISLITVLIFKYYSLVTAHNRPVANA